jgi:hypothetical protein
MIGTVGVVRLPGDAFFDSAEIAYGIHSDFWGKGYASEALGMFVGLYWTAGRESLFSIYPAAVTRNLLMIFGFDRRWGGCEELIGSEH